MIFFSARDTIIIYYFCFKGTIIDIQEGAVNGIVKIDIGGGNIISSTISMNAIKELGLTVGKTAYAVIKATSVMVGVDE